MRRLLASALLVPLLGCVAAPERREPLTEIDLPEVWTAAETEPLPTRDGWWNEFGDPALDALVAVALEENRDLRAAAARVDRAEAEARIAGADLRPQASAGLTASRQKQNFIGLPIPGQEGVLSTTYTRYGLSLDISWEVDLWGRLRAGARAAAAELQATDADLSGARLSIAGQTAKAWFAVLHAGQQVELARDSVAGFRDLSEEVRSRYEKGLRPPVELRLALSNLAGAEALLARRLDELDRATRQLELLLGRYPAGSLLEHHDAGKLPPLPAPVPAGLPADLVARRPDLVAAERRLAAADQRLLQAHRSLYPRLTLTGSGGSASEELGDLLDGDFGVWSLAGGLLQPIFQGGRLRANVDRADAVEREILDLHGGGAARLLRGRVGAGRRAPSRRAGAAPGRGRGATGRGAAPVG